MINVKHLLILAVPLVLVGCDGGKDDTSTGGTDGDGTATGTGTGTGAGTGTGTGTATGTGTGGTGTGGVDFFAQCDDPFVACGGDVAGTWNVVAVCSLELADNQGCEELTWEIVDDRSSGTIDFLGAGTYSQTYNLDLDFLLSLPRTCLFGQPCDMVATLFADFVDGCTEVTGICECTGSLVDTTTDTGTWTMDGDVLVTDGTTRTEVCVQGTRGEGLGDDGTRTIWTR